MRLTLVPVSKMMDKEAHARNAFHFSCWGAHPKRATNVEKAHDRWGFSLVGSDGRHGVGAGYYTERVQVPPVVPDGEYILGWTWYGGTGGKVFGNKPQRPKDHSYFGDYWSCSFVRVHGGVEVAHKYTPVFHNGMSQFSKKGCMAFTDRPGVCAVEPCENIKGRYQKPAEFKKGVPKAITPDNFESEEWTKSSKGMQTGFGRWDWGQKIRMPTPSPKPRRKRMQKSFRWNGRRYFVGVSACLCLHDDEMCVVDSSDSGCKDGVAKNKQPDLCYENCCTYCEKNLRSSVCFALGIEGGCE